MVKCLMLWILEFVLKHDVDQTSPIISIILWLHWWLILFIFPYLGSRIYHRTPFEIKYFIHSYLQLDIDWTNWLLGGVKWTEKNLLHLRASKALHFYLHPLLTWIFALNWCMGKLSIVWFPVWFTVLWWKAPSVWPVDVTMVNVPNDVLTLTKHRTPDPGNFYPVQIVQLSISIFWNKKMN